MRKEIYASLSIADHEIRILVSEFHNGRLNILKVERVEHGGIIDNKIVDESDILTAINKGLKHIEANLQFKISRVILLINSKNVKRVFETLHSDVNDPLNRITLGNIQHIYQQAMNSKPVAGMELINVDVYRYKVNGAYIYKMPINEKTARLYADVDFYYVDRDLVYALANIVEKADLEILDVCIDSYALGKEAGLFTKKPEEYVVGIQLERQTTTLALYYKGRLASTAIINYGTQNLINNVSKSLSIPQSVAARLMLGNVDYGQNSPGEAPVYLWSSDKKSFTCSQRDIMDIIRDDSEEMFREIKEGCQAIIDSGPTTIVLVGEGSMLKGLDGKLSTVLGVEVNSYLPTTLGARDGAFVASLGAFYATIDHQRVQTYQKTSVEVIDYEEAVGLKKSDESDTSFSQRFKSFIKDPIRGGNIHD